MEYPERTKRIRMLRLLLDQFRKNYSRGHDHISLIFYRNDRDGWTDVRTGYPDVSIPAQLGLSVAECVNLIEKLSSGDYIYFTSRGERAQGPWHRSIWFGQVDYNITHLTDKGLREIGELPDPQAQPIQGFEAAIEAIKHDNRLTDREKRQKINWLQEGTVIARTLSMDAIKAILAGAIL